MARPIASARAATLRVLAIAVCCVATTAAFAAEPPCADFLAQASRLPPHTDFTGCKPAQVAQLRAQVATYRVDGAHARAVERYLMRRTGMARLKFLCCGWEPAMGGPRRLGRVTLKGESLEVSMTSGETLVNRRDQWSRIESFEVSVTRLLDAP